MDSYNAVRCLNMIIITVYTLCQEKCAMLEKKCNGLLYVFSYTLSRNKTAGTAVKFFKDVLFLKCRVLVLVLVPGKERSLFL